MKHYVLKIKDRFIQSIVDGTKTHEYRLGSSERRKISIGDKLLLVSNENPNKLCTVTVTSSESFSNWEDALKDDWKKDFSHLFNSYSDVLKECQKFYSRDEIQEYGIIKFGISLTRTKIRNARVLLDTNIIIHRESFKNVSFEVAKGFNWLDKLKDTKIVHPDSILEIEKYNDANIKKGILIKLDSYEKLLPHHINDDFFNSIVCRFSLDENSKIDNNILYQVYDGVVDLLITNDLKIIAKAGLLGIRDNVFSIDEFLKFAEESYPKKVDYQMLSVKKEQFGTIDLSEPFFDTLKTDYPEFERWFNSKNAEETYVFREDSHIHAFLYVKVEFEDEESYFKISPQLPPKKRLKVGTFKIDEHVKGFRLSERFLKIIFDNARINNVDEIYVTLFEHHRQEIDNLRDVLCKWGFFKWGTKAGTNGKIESVFVKAMDLYNDGFSIKENFPNLISGPNMFFLPINPEYHTELFPDSILKSEDMNLYSENKAHLYSLEKIYVSGTFNQFPKPGDIIVIYRSGERWPKKYSSVCTGLAILEGLYYPKTLDEFLSLCSNKSVFSDKELSMFYSNKKYRTVVKLIQYKTFDKKITLEALQNEGLVGEFSGPRPFDRIDPKHYGLFMKEE